MTSDRQSDANRANAQYSTGPKTPEGKSGSRYGALKHGLYARDVVLPGENQQAYDTMLAKLRDDFEPRGGAEDALVKRLVDIWWRLDRAAGIETGFLNPDWNYDRLRMNDQLVDIYRISIDNVPTLDQLGRYEARLERALSRTMQLLRTTQSMRKIKKQEST